MTFNKSGVVLLWCIAFTIGAVFYSCREEKKGPFAFKLLTSESTGLKFANNLNSTDSFNLFKYMYFYNGAGVGAADFNNDGLTDLFFASNQGQNSLFLNRGNLKFEDVTAKAKIPSISNWSTGVSIVDINNDGLNDIYISSVGNFSVLKSHNQLLVCQGIDKQGVPYYEDKAREYGLDFSGFGTQAAFLDYDLDGDLDIFFLNHSIHESGNFRERKYFIGTYSPTGSKLYRNDGDTFTNVTAASGINSSAIGYGLGVVISDLNSDGYPDIYVGNDFHENDYMYINQKNGQFKDMSDSCLMHTSKYTMGVDVADANNDGLPEVMTVDMLPFDPYMLKRTPGEDSYDVFNLRISYGYNYQYARNSLQLNRGNGHYSETALYSGVAATDWSWAPLFMDFDNDGLKDLFISNGIPKRMNDIDYINYISDQSIQEKLKNNKLGEKDEALIDKFPEIKIPNRFFKNSGDLKFQDMHEMIGGEVPAYSNGAVYADLDGDGDLDVVVNNIDDNVHVYQNLSNDKRDQRYLDVKLKGASKNTNALGSKILVYAEGDIQIYEKYPVRGFLSSMEEPVHIGLNKNNADSVILIWPDNTYEKISDSADAKAVTITYKKGLPKFDYGKLLHSKTISSTAVTDITDETGIRYNHTEDIFPEFDREPLMPHMVSTEGPALAVADINADGLEDAFIGASKGGKRGLFIQQPDGHFTQMHSDALEIDSMFEDVDACWTDVNNDSFPDLVVASGGNEYYGKDYHLLPRVYLNDGKGNLARKTDAVEGIFETEGCVAASDFTGDGYVDLFIGGRGVPLDNGLPPKSYLLQNDGTGKFTDVTAKYCPELDNAGFVTKAIWIDLDGNGKNDLVLSSEWGTIDAYLNSDDKLSRKVLSSKKGWWNFILPIDVNGDGKMDLLAGNLGLNSRLSASEKKPVKLYYNDFDENGKKEQILTYYLGDKEIPFASKAEMERQLPGIRKQFLYAKDFAHASLEDIVSNSKLKSANQYTADYFANCLLINKGDLNFDVVALPWEAQLTTFRDAAIVNANGDSLPDVMLAGNYYENSIDMGRYDADYGSVLINNGKGGFEYSILKDLAIKGQSRKIRKIKIGQNDCYIIARNNDSAKVIRFVPHVAQ